MRVTSHKTLMCNKLCNCLFSDVLAKRPALDAWSALAGIRPSRVWTLCYLMYGSSNEVLAARQLSTRTAWFCEKCFHQG